MAILSCSCGSRTGTDRAGVRQDTTFDILCCEAVSVVHRLETLVQRPPGRMILVSPTVYCFKLNFSCSYVFILQLYHAARERVSHVKGSSCALDMLSVCTVGCRRTTFSNHLPSSRWPWRRRSHFPSFIFPPLLHLHTFPPSMLLQAPPSDISMSDMRYDTYASTQARLLPIQETSINRTDKYA